MLYLSFFHCAVITPTEEERGIVCVTAGLFVLKTGSVDWLAAKATEFLLLISCYSVFYKNEVIYIWVGRIVELKYTD